MNKKLFIVAFIAVGLLGFRYNDNLQAMGLKFIAPTVNDKANVYQPEAGEIVYDASVSKFFGQDHASNWVELSAGDSVMPAGVILPFGGSTAPNGYLFANGSAVSRTVYADLFAAIGTSFGAGDGSTTFNLPDLRGRFMRGVDSGSGNDPDASSRTASNTGGNTGNQVGSVQGDALKSHSHTVNHSDSGGYAGPNLQGRGGSSGTHTSSATGGNETRPKNIYVNYIIKI